MSVVPEQQRISAWNVRFLDQDDQVFAGVYSSPFGPWLFSDLFDQLLSIFRFTQDPEGNWSTGGSSHPDKERAKEWEIWPTVCTASRCAAFSCNAWKLEPRDGHDMPLSRKVVLPGDYYLVYHDKSCVLNGTNVGNHLKVPCHSIAVVAGLTEKILFANYVSGYQPCVPVRPLQGPDGRSIWEEIAMPHASFSVPFGVESTEERLGDFSAKAKALNNRCAISGSEGPVFGFDSQQSASGLWPEAYHIIPPQYFEEYPVPYAYQQRGGDWDLRRFSSTWDPLQNAITLLPHFHILFQARLMAINPDNFRVHCFGRIDHMAFYDGEPAHFTPGFEPDIRALRWHWQACCYENLAAHAHQVASLRDQAMLDPPAGGKRAGQDLASAQRKKARSSATQSRGFCTQKCIHGLKAGNDDFDYDCPNVGSHAKNPETFRNPGHHPNLGTVVSACGSLCTNKGGDGAGSSIEILAGKFGQNSQLLRIVLNGGYIVVGKGVSAEFRHKIVREDNVYKRLGDLQGKIVTECLGIVDLAPPYQYTSAEPISTVLLQAWAGEPAKEANLLLEVLLEHRTRSSQEFERLGLVHQHPWKRLLWNEEKQRIMVIGFDKDGLDPDDPVLDPQSPDVQEPQ